MDTMADACSCTIVDDVLPCESASAALRRRRIEIRRIRILANSSGAGFVEPLKRSRISSSFKGAQDGRNNCKKSKDNNVVKGVSVSATVVATTGTVVEAATTTVPTSGVTTVESLATTTSGTVESPTATAMVAPSASSTILESSLATTSGTMVTTSGTVVTTPGTMVKSEGTQQENEPEEEKSGTSSTTQSSPPSCSTALDACPSYGTISVCGRRREMEDAVAVARDFITLPCFLGGCTSCSQELSSSSLFHFFGVYDGHSGAQVADFCKDRMHLALVEELNKAVLMNQEECWQRAMSSCFLKVDEEVRNPCEGDACRKCGGEGCEGPRIPENVGSTAVVAVVGGNIIIVANCGDSRAVLSRGGKAIPLSVDHKAGRPDEMARVEAAGGKVIPWDVLRILGILAMSRSIGDQYMSDYVIADPEVTCTTRSDEDEFLILASDGLWDKVSNEDACDIARKCLTRRMNQSKISSSHQSNNEESPANDAACLLLKKALGNGSKDNISIVVVDLRRQKQRS